MHILEFKIKPFLSLLSMIVPITGYAQLYSPARNGLALLNTHFAEWPGKNIIIAQKEHQADTSILDLKRVLLPSPLSSSQKSVHASTVASIMAGRGLISPLTQGIAREAKLMSVNFSQFFPEEDSFYSRNNVSIVNHSYGNKINNQYSPEAAAYDAQAQRMPHLLHVFSSGNQGYDVAPSGRYQALGGYANLTGDYKMSKNTLAIGAHDEQGKVVFNSSRGPAYDGRIKPELVAYSKDGTSFSAAVASGVVARLQDFYRDEQMVLPSAALLKATLIASAKELYTPGPDHLSGYGAIDASGAMEVLQKMQYIEGSLAPFSQHTYSINVPDQATSLRIALVWTDPAAASNAIKALVNDLNLQLSKGQENWQPWVLSTAPHLDSLAKAAVPGVDQLNNVELISLEQPAAGTYTIRVSTEQLQGSTQAFSIAYTYQLQNTLQWEYPAKGTWLAADQLQWITWSSKVKQKGSLEYSIDEGANWQKITDSLDVREGQYLWKTPIHVGNIQLRIQLSGKIWPSDPFQLYEPLRVSPSNFCGDSLELNWKATRFYKEYLIQVFDEKTFSWQDLQKTDQLETTLKNRSTQDWISVVPLLSNGEKGLRAPAFSLQYTPVACYVIDWAPTAQFNQVQVSLQLSTIRGIKGIGLERKNNSSFEQIAEKEATTELNHQLIDPAPLPGSNTYRLVLNLTNGQKVLSEEKLVFVIAQQQSLAVFPNPISAQDEPLQVVTQLAGNITLCDVSGRKLFQTNIVPSQSQVQIPNLEKGLYLLIFQNERGEQRTEKLIVK